MARASAWAKPSSKEQLRTNFISSEICFSHANGRRGMIGRAREGGERIENALLAAIETAASAADRRE